MRILAADTKLVIDGERTLKIAGIAGVSGTSQNHGSSPSLSDVTSEGPVVASRFCFLISVRYSRTSAGIMTLSSQDFGVGMGPTAATDRWIVKAIVGRHFSWGKQSSVD